MKWHPIETQADADDLMKLFGGFHDGCIREAHIWTGYWVSPDLSMFVPGDLDTKARIHIQRQWKNPAAIELLFEEVTRFNLIPAPEDHESIIHNATLLVRNGEVYWSPYLDWNPDNPDCNSETWISARKLQWREVENWLGEPLQYGLKT